MKDESLPVAIPLVQAVVCLDCSAIYRRNGGRYNCPLCASSAAHPLPAWLKRNEVKP